MIYSTKSAIVKKDDNGKYRVTKIVNDISNSNTDACRVRGIERYDDKRAARKNARKQAKKSIKIYG